MSSFVRWLQDTLANETGDEVRDLRVDPPIPDRPLNEPAAHGDSILTVDWSNGGGEPRHRRLVLRRPSITEAGNADVLSREANTLAGIGVAGTVPIPRVLGVEPGSDLIGTPFVLVEHINGHTFIDGSSMRMTEWASALSAEQQMRLHNSAMDALVGIHRIDWRNRHGFLLDGLDLERLLDRRLRELHHRYRAVTAGATIPVTDAALRIVLDRRPEIFVREPVLVWGRAHVGNMIFGKRHTCVAVTNWVSATIGAPEIDLAHWLVHDAAVRESVDASQRDRWPDRSATVSDYQLRAGRTLVNLDYFELIEELALATELIETQHGAGSDAVTAATTENNPAVRLIAQRLGL